MCWLMFQQSGNILSGVGGSEIGFQSPQKADSDIQNWQEKMGDTILLGVMEERCTDTRKQSPRLSTSV